jgi:hypothetical protein
MATTVLAGLFVTTCTFSFLKKISICQHFAIDNGIGQRQTFYQAQAPPLMPASCKHPQVRVVAREEDVEFVECQFCGEVFDSAEFVDILNEEDPVGDGHESQGDEAQEA